MKTVLTPWRRGILMFYSHLFVFITKSNEKTAASELVEYREEMFPRYHMDSDSIDIFKYHTQLCYPSQNG